jgi:hypothetical protein
MYASELPALVTFPAPKSVEPSGAPPAVTLPLASIASASHELIVWSLVPLSRRDQRCAPAGVADATNALNPAPVIVFPPHVQSDVNGRNHKFG